MHLNSDFIDVDEEVSDDRAAERAMIATVENVAGAESTEFIATARWLQDVCYIGWNESEVHVLKDVERSRGILLKGGVFHFRDFVVEDISFSTQIYHPAVNDHKTRHKKF